MHCLWLSPTSIFQEFLHRSMMRSNNTDSGLPSQCRTVTPAGSLSSHYQATGPIAQGSPSLPSKCIKETVRAARPGNLLMNIWSACQMNHLSCLGMEQSWRCGRPVSKVGHWQLSVGIWRPARGRTPMPSHNPWLKVREKYAVYCAKGGCIISSRCQVWLNGRVGVLVCS